ncbi:MAG: VWA domain-containing protein [Flexilinea sp.]|nr:VWA domain-containing protein [Flexilinea sp.]
MKKKPVILFLLMLTFLISTLSARADEALEVQVRRSGAQPFSDRVGYTVNLYVSVVDGDGRPLRGLGTDNFKVYEDSLPQTLTEARSAEDEPVSVALLMDLSGSMLGQNAYDTGAIETFLRKLSRDSQSAVIGFNERVSILSRFTSDHNASINAALGAKPENGKGSCLYDALYEGLELTLSQPAGRRAVALFTDGTDELASGERCSSRALSDVLNFAAGNRIPVFTVGLGEKTDERELQHIAENSGGSFLKVSPQLSMEGAFELIYAQLSHEYKLSYKTERNAGEHSVLVEAEKDASFGKSSGVVSLPVMPTIMQFGSPEEGSAQSGEVQLSVSFISQSSAVANVEYFAGGQSLGKVINYPYTLSWDSSGVTPGTTIVEAIAYDRENRELARASRMFILREAPTAAPTDVPSPEPTLVPTQAPLPVTEEKSGANPVLLVSLGGLAAAVVILSILLTRKSSREKSETPVYIPPVSYPVFSGSPETSAVPVVSSSDTAAELATLEVIHSDDQSLVGSIYKVNSLPLTLGRAADNNVVFTELDRAVGRHHAVLEEVNGQIAIRDLNSRYGTYVNEQRTGLMPVALSSGDAVRLGSRMTLKFTRMLSPLSADEAGDTILFSKAPEQQPEGESTVKVMLLGKSRRK